MSDEALSVEDRLEILELLARADDAASNRDIETYITLFTDDADLQGIKGVHRGKDALRAGAPGVWAAEGPASRHLTLNGILHPDARAGAVTATSTLLIIAASHPPTILSISAITQVVCKVNGDWLIRRRVVEHL
jgi:hypothetical protein